MTVASPTDGLFGICHIVGAYPALGLAICLGIGGVATGAIPVNLTNPPANLNNSCVSGEDFFLIDMASAERTFSLYECLDEYEPITRSELQVRCLTAEGLSARDQEFCSQLL